MSVKAEVKRCTRCGETKPRGEFSPNTYVRDGLASRCRPCHREAVRESRQRHGYDRERARMAARDRAAALFRERFPDEWWNLVADEEARRGITRDLWERRS